MSRVTDGWHGKIDEFEKINQGLQDSLSKLRDENELLRLKVGSQHYTGCPKKTLLKEKVITSLRSVFWDTW